MANSWIWTEGSDMKVCLVTTGATAPFTGLIESVLQPLSLSSLIEGGYTHLLIQYGTAKEVFNNCVSSARRRVQDTGKKLIIEGMDFDPNGLQEQFKLVQQSKGLVISHAGMSYLLWEYFQKIILFRFGHDSRCFEI